MTRRMVKDTDGGLWNVYDVLEANSFNQIYPGMTAVYIGEKAAERCITIPQPLARGWLKGEVRIKVS